MLCYFNSENKNSHDIITVVKASKQEAHRPQSSPELQSQIAVTCYLDSHDDSSMLDLKLYNSTRGPM